MTARRRSVLLGVCAAALLALGAAAAVVRAEERAARAAAAARVAAERQALETDIAFYDARIARDPIGAADRTQLAALYLQRARATGDYADVLRAEDLARQSLALRGGHNAKTYPLLVAALLAEHRFPEALAIARRLHAWDPTAVSFFAQMAEIEMELGQYAAAGAAFDSLWTRRNDLSVAPRLAHWAEIRGDTGLARRLLGRALAEAERRADLPREQVAWYWLRVGDLALRTGRAADAGYAFDQGLAVVPDDYRLLAGRARLEAATGRWREAIADGEMAITTVPDPATLGLLSDAYAARADSDHAAQYARAMEVAVLGQPGQWHRAWSLFLLDHDRRIPEVLAHVQAELRTRHDVYGYDLLAWALHHAGRDGEARIAMRRALALGTVDPLLRRHASALGL